MQEKYPPKPENSADLDRESTASVQVAASRPVGINLCVIGGGFVGLVTAAGFAEFGHSVVCVEKDLARFNLLCKGEIPFYEKKLPELIKRNIECNRLTFSNDLVESVTGRQVIFIAVGTPESKSGRTDSTALDEIAHLLAENLQSGQIIVLKSTVPVGTGSRFKQILNSNSYSERNISVVNNPEFLREGNAVDDFFHPRRIVIGCDEARAIEIVAQVYRLGMKPGVPIVTTNNETAEMIKYASNAFLATKIGFINELAGLCDPIGINVLEVTRAMRLDPRIGPEFLSPGPGWGGSCFRKDMKELMGLADSMEFPLIIARAVLESNQRQHLYVVEKVRRLTGSLSNARIGILGLSFKAGTSDMRDSPAIPIINELVKEGALVVAYDPQAKEQARECLPDLKLVDNIYDTADKADCLVILTEWQEFQLLDFKRIKTIMNRPNLVDARNLLTPETVRRYGLNYLGMGQS